MSSDDRLFGKLVDLAPVPDTYCWKTPKDFVENLKKWLGFEFVKSKNLDLIVVGSETPGPDDTNKMWASFDRNNNFTGWKSFYQGQWRRAYTEPNYQLQWFYNPTPNQPPALADGFVLADGQTPGVPDLRDDFKGTAPNYTVYIAVFKGYGG